MSDTKKLAEQTRSLIDHLHHRQAMIANHLKGISYETSGTLKKSKSVSFLDDELDESNGNDVRVGMFDLSRDSFQVLPSNFRRRRSVYGRVPS